MRFYITITMVICLCVIVTQSASKYEELSLNKKQKRLQTEFYIADKKQKSYFHNEIDAANKLNKFDDKMGKSPENCEICEISRQHNKKKTSQYKGVFWDKNKKKWYVLIRLKEWNKKYGGTFKHEIDAGKRVNQLCKEFGISPQNPAIDAMPNQKHTTKQMTSQYKGVCWNKEKRKWYVHISLKGDKQRYGGVFEDELDAAKRVNHLCEEFEIPLKNPEIIENRISNQQYQNKKKTSQYKEVYWHKQIRKWYVSMYLPGGTRKYDGTFKNEVDAGKMVNHICKEWGLPLKNPEIGDILNQQHVNMKIQKFKKHLRKSQYKGVYYHTQSRNWCAIIYLRRKIKYGGIFKDEVDAAKRVNQLCEEFKIPSLNPGITAMPNPNQQCQRKEKTSQYTGVSHRRKTDKWYARFHLKGHPPKYGGQFDDEINAARRVNQLCLEKGIPPQNPSLSAMPSQPPTQKHKISQYKNVTWNKKSGKWCVQLQVKGQTKYFGTFNVEVDAAKTVNRLCEEFGITPHNPSIVEIPIQQAPKTLLNSDDIQPEFKGLIKILDEKNDPTIPTIKENLVSAINNEEQTIMTEINLRTQNGESALSIAAKYGFANAVELLISKGANKEHFTNEHHTPLSLAVSQDHLKVIQALFKDWISPNSHIKPYLHLSPIFNVKSREIAQLLIDNDAVTHEIYNNKNQSPLTVACQNGYLDVVDFFLDDGLDINHLDNDNKTPLCYALANKHHDVANLLISKGAKSFFHQYQMI